MFWLLLVMIYLFIGIAYLVIIRLDFFGRNFQLFPMAYIAHTTCKQGWVHYNPPQEVMVVISWSMMLLFDLLNLVIYGPYYSFRNRVQAESDEQGIVKLSLRRRFYRD